MISKQMKAIFDTRDVRTCLMQRANQVHVVAVSIQFDSKDITWSVAEAATRDAGQNCVLTAVGEELFNAK
jgi:leucyl aminopeptidase (aminopeptidase T)